MRHIFGAMLLIPLTFGCSVHKKELEAMVLEQQDTIALRDHTILEQNGEIGALDGKLAHSQTALAAERERAAQILIDSGLMSAEITSMRLAMEQLEERRQLTEARMAEYRDLTARFMTLIDAGTLEVKIVDGRMVVGMATDVLFPSGSAVLSPQGDEALTEVAKVLSGLDKDFQIEGHTDDVPISSAKYPSNWHLASGRALGVIEHLITAGMSPEHLSAASYGDEHPVATNATPEGKASNRRIEIVVMPDLSNLPGYDELTGIATADLF